MPINLPVPKKPRTTTQHGDSVAAVTAKVNAQYTARKAGLVRSASTKQAHRLTSAEFQAVVDKVQKDAGLQHRMVVTAKEFGFLRKRLEQSPPSDMTEFISWVLRYWTTIAQQHRAALRKNDDRKAAGEKGIPAHPDFASLAFRYPYFLKCFANFKAERTMQAKDDANEREAKLQETIRRQKEEISSLRRARPTSRPAMAPAEPAAPPARRPVSRRPAPVIDYLGGEDLPEWTTPPTKQGARRG